MQLKRRLSYAQGYLELGMVAEAAAELAGVPAAHHDTLDVVVLRLALPDPRDVRVTRELARYKGLDPRWHDWPQVVGACEALALRLAEGQS